MTLRFLLTLLLAPCLLFAVEEADSTPLPESTPAADHPQRLRSLIDELNQASLQEAFRLLTSDYINHDSLDDLEVNRAALQGMLNRLEFGAMLLTKKQLSERNSPFQFHHAKVDENTAYIRFGKFDRSGVDSLDKALAEFAETKGLTHLIVDLRSPQAQAEFSIASEILSRFSPPNELLFKIRRPGNDRPTLFVSQPVTHTWNKSLILLVDTETGNVGEIISAVLRRETNCLIIGEKTPGLTVEYRDVPIGEDQILRYAIAEVVLEDDSSIFQVGITPDIVTPTDPVEKRGIYRLTENGDPLTDFLFQKQRPRLNEAALVAGTDPEIDYFLLRSNNKPTPWDHPPKQDRALQQAVDLLQTAEFLDYEREKRR